MSFVSMQFPSLPPTPFAHTPQGTSDLGLKRLLLSLIRPAHNVAHVGRACREGTAQRFS